MGQSLIVKHNIELAHRLACLPGKCANIHGHSWWCHLEIIDQYSNAKSERDGSIILDLHDIKKKFRAFLDDNFDHRLALDQHDPLIEELDAGQILDQYPGVVVLSVPPTVENMARIIGQEMQKQFDATGSTYEYAVELYEAATNCATWRSRIT